MARKYLFVASCHWIPPLTPLPIALSFQKHNPLNGHPGWKHETCICKAGASAGHVDSYFPVPKPAGVPKDLRSRASVNKYEEAYIQAVNEFIANPPKGYIKRLNHCHELAAQALYSGLQRLLTVTVSNCNPLSPSYFKDMTIMEARGMTVRTKTKQQTILIGIQKITCSSFDSIRVAEP
jgi:hypothetical protein